MAWLRKGQRLLAWAKTTLLCINHPDVEYRRRGQNVIVLAVALMALSMLLLAGAISSDKHILIETLRFGVRIGLLCGLIALAQRGYVTLAASALSGLFVFSVLVGLLLEGALVPGVVFLCLSILMASVTLSARGVLFMICVCCLFLVLLSTALPLLTPVTFNDTDIIQISAILCCFGGMIGALGARSAMQALRGEQHARTHAEATSAALDEINRTLEHRVAERTAELAQSQSLLRGLIDNSPALIFVKDLQGRLLVVNQHYSALAGREIEDIVGKTEADLFPAELAEIWSAQGRQIITTRQPLETEETMLLEDGEYTYVTSLFPIQDAQRGVIGVGGIAADVTERRRTEAALRRSETTLSAIFRNSRQSFLFIDRAYTIQAFNKAADERAREIYRRELYVGVSILEFITADMREIFYAHFQQALHGESIVVERAIPSISGNARWFEFRYAPVYDDDQQALGVLMIMHDVTERKLLEIANKENERRYRAIFNSTFQFMGLLRPDGVLLEVNQTVLDFGGLQLEDVVGRPIWDTPWLATTPEARTRMRAAVVEAADGAFIRYETEIRGADDTRAVIDFSIKPLKDETGKVVLLIPEGRDITERKRAEAILQQSNERLRALYAIAQAILSARSPDDVAQAAMNQLNQLLPDSNIYVAGLDAATNHARILPTQHDAETNNGVFDAVEFEHVGALVETLIREQHVPPVDRYNNGSLDTPDHGMRLTLPLVAHHNFLGALSVGVEQADVLGANYLDIAKEVAALLAIGLRQAQLYEQTREDAETKAMLLREVNHRVKNNLAAIIALLYAERRRNGLDQAPDYQNLIHDLVSRVQSLAAVHGLLSASDWQPPRLSVLVERVISLALQALPPDTSVTLAIDDVPVLVTADQAHNLALVINELATNTVKHGRFANYALKICVVITWDDTSVELTFRDNGPGYPAHMVQADRHIGLDLMQNIVRRNLRGAVSTHNDGGAVTVIRFEHAMHPR
jgi:PAS domain S-box-containing protein